MNEIARGDTSDRPEATWFLADSYLKMNQVDSARKTLEELCRDYPRSEFVPMAWARLGQLAEKENDQFGSCS